MAEGKEQEKLALWVKLFGPVWGPRLLAGSLIVGTLAVIAGIVIPLLPKDGPAKPDKPVVIVPIPIPPQPGPTPEPEDETQLHPPVAMDGSDVDGESGWFSSPPQVRLNGTLPPKKRDGGVTTYLVRKVDQRDQPQIVEPASIRWKQPEKGGQIIAEIDTGSAISTLYPTHPHGLYKLYYAAGGKESPRLAFNYALRANYATQAWAFNAKDVFTPGSGGRALVMQHARKVGGHSAIQLGQKFNFFRGVRIKGRFTAQPLDAEDVVGLDVCVFNNDTGDIATASFEAGKTPVAVIRKRFNRKDDVSDPPGYTVHVAGDGQTDNYFEVAYLWDGEEIEGKLWLGQGPVNAGRPADASITLMQSSRPWNPDRVELRIWKGGTIELKSLSIAEAASDVAGTLAQAREDASGEEIGSWDLEAYPVSWTRAIER